MMKNYFPACAFLLLSIVSCNSSDHQHKTFFQRVLLPTLEPSHTETFQLNFQDITVSQGIKVEIYKSKSTFVEVVGPKNLTNQLNVETEGKN